MPRRTAVRKSRLIREKVQRCLQAEEEKGKEPERSVFPESRSFSKRS